MGSMFARGVLIPFTIFSDRILAWGSTVLWAEVVYKLEENSSGSGIEGSSVRDLRLRVPAQERLDAATPKVCSGENVLTLRTLVDLENPAVKKIFLAFPSRTVR